MQTYFINIDRLHKSLVYKNRSFFFTTHYLKRGVNVPQTSHVVIAYVKKLKCISFPEKIHALLICFFFHTVTRYAKKKLNAFIFFNLT
jgi:hypothetical protein